MGFAKTGSLAFCKAKDVAHDGAVRALELTDHRHRPSRSAKRVGHARPLLRDPLIADRTHIGGIEFPSASGEKNACKCQYTNRGDSEPSHDEPLAGVFRMTGAPTVALAVQTVKLSSADVTATLSRSAIVRSFHCRGQRLARNDR